MHRGTTHLDSGSVARKHRIAAALAGLALAVAPAAAHAQGGAGDQQYQDPFGAGQTQTAPKAQQPSAPLSQAPPVTSAPATPAPFWACAAAGASARLRPARAAAMRCLRATLHESRACTVADP